MIRTLRIFNFGPFRGEHVLELEPKAYSVVARWEHDAERSNYGGKSSLLEAVDFCLWGRHRHRLEEGWITRGESEGRVEIVTDAGSRMVRRKKRGGPTVFECDSALQVTAREMVEQIVGFTADDFLETCYFQQRQMARLILAKPGDRLDVVRAWLRLEPLEVCEERVRAGLTALAREEQVLSAKLAEDRARLACAGRPEDLRAMADRLGGEMDELQESVTAAEVARALADSDRLVVEEYKRVAAEGTRLRREHDELAAMPLTTEKEAADREFEAVKAELARIEEEGERQKKLYVRGFDGRCPVVCMPCPAADEINSKRAEFKTAAEAAGRASADVWRRFSDAEVRSKQAWARAEVYRTTRERLGLLRDRARALKPLYDQARARVGSAPPSETLSKDKARLQELAHGRAQALADARRGEEARKAIEDVRGRLDELGKALQAHREALAVFGRNGAQRVVAEAALGQIEAGANSLLASCGVDLSLAVRWSREGQGLAKACEACGEAFPASARAKSCARCGAERGPNLVARLDVEPSARSGAADDLCGMALQLSASAWLRADRLAGWRCALLDEPFGQLDRAHRRSVGSVLGRMLAEAGFCQALVVAHTADTVEALPGKILVTARHDGSRVEVIA